MALKLHFASLSLGASVDQQTGNLSVFDILEEIRTPQLPVHLQSLVIALSLEKTDNDPFSGKMVIHILTPDGKQQMIGNGEMSIPAEQKRMKAVFRYGGFPVGMYGRHRLVLSWLNTAGTKVGEALLDFDAVQVTQVAQGVAPADKPPISH
ncbi:MAG: hypothetical protein NDJ89_02250 [Oligoflexia bacterium]|nr:hypothetical protein [Oligoflexia bacterium]